MSVETMTDVKTETPNVEVNPPETEQPTLTPQEYVNNQAQLFHNEVMKHSNAQFGVEYLMSVCRQLAQKDLELQQRERELWAYQQNITQLSPYGRAPFLSPYAPQRGRGRGRGGRSRGRGRGRGRGWGRGRGRGQNNHNRYQPYENNNPPDVIDVMETQGNPETQSNTESASNEVII